MHVSQSALGNTLLSPKRRALAAWGKFGTTLTRCLVLDQLGDHVERFGIRQTITLLDATYQSARIGRRSLQQVPEYQERFHPEQLVLADEVTQKFNQDEIEMLMSQIVWR